MFKPKTDVRLKRTSVTWKSVLNEVLEAFCELLKIISKPKKKTEKTGIIGIVLILFLVIQCDARGTAITSAIKPKYDARE
jgi:hypothetical protein